METIDRPFPVPSRWFTLGLVLLMTVVGLVYRFGIYDERKLSERALAGMTGERTIGSGDSARYRPPKTYHDAMH
jgi:hypothetical protein